MSEQNYTPEPWAWQKFGKEWCLTGQHGMRPIILAVRKGALTSLVNGLLVPLDPKHPDAQLIAAAPETKRQRDALLVALKQVESWNQSDIDAFDDITPDETMLENRAEIVRAAIALCEKEGK